MGEACQVTDLIPLPFDRLDLNVDDLLCLLFGEQIGGGPLHAPGDLAHAPPIPSDGHDLRRLAAAAQLWADVIGGGEAEGFPVPKGGMVAGMVVVVAAEDV